MNILILSTSTNDHASRVEKALFVRKCNPVRLNVDMLWDSQPTLTISILSNLIKNETINIPLERIHSVFVHHPVIEVPKNCGVDTLDRALYKASWINAIDYIETATPSSLWVNKPSVCHQTASVIQQLDIAKRLGFKIPATILTNQIQDLKNFSTKFSKVIIKPGNLPGIRTKGRRMLVRLVDVNLINKEVLLNAPCLFQEYIEKDYEIRVHVIGKEVLACKIDSQKSIKTKIDWRNYDLKSTPHESISLKNDLSEKCRRVVQKMGLQMGIIDLIRTPSGETFFLECNSQGHWIWIEELTGLPITDKICELLTQ